MGFVPKGCSVEEKTETLITFSLSSCIRVACSPYPRDPSPGDAVLGAAVPSHLYPTVSATIRLPSFDFFFKYFSSN